MLPFKQFALSKISPVLLVVFTSHRKQDIFSDNDLLKFLARESSTTLSIQKLELEKMYGISAMEM